MHLMIDGYVRDPDTIENREFIYNFLDTYPSEISMTKVSTPQVSQHISSPPQEHGMSGFVLLAESHISIHLFPEQAYVNIDIFSCTEFDADRAIRTLERKFGLNGVKARIIDRPLADIG